jgi:hypothetical protein
LDERKKEKGMKFGTAASQRSFTISCIWTIPGMIQTARELPWLKR